MLVAMRQGGGGEERKGVFGANSARPVSDEPCFHGSCGTATCIYGNLLG